MEIFFFPPQTTPLSDVMDQLSLILKVPAARLLLLREAVELPTDSTISELGLGIADIIGESQRCEKSPSVPSVCVCVCSLSHI